MASAGGAAGNVPARAMQLVDDPDRQQALVIAATQATPVTQARSGATATDAPAPGATGSLPGPSADFQPVQSGGTLQPAGTLIGRQGTVASVYSNGFKLRGAARAPALARPPPPAVASAAATACLERISSADGAPTTCLFNRSD